MSPRSQMDVDMDDDEHDPDAMDVDPASPMRKAGRSGNDDASWLRPQRFFAPEEPTGLENLFAKTIRLVDSSEATENGPHGIAIRRSTHRRNTLRDWRLWAALCIVPLFAVGYRVLYVRTQSITPMPIPL